jgi:hypothetical protein
VDCLEANRLEHLGEIEFWGELFCTVCDAGNLGLRVIEKITDPRFGIFD